MKEIWKDIVGFEGIYQVSNLGRVKSLSRVRSFGCQTRVVLECILKDKVKTTGYHYVILYKDGKNFSKHVHRLVAEAFIPNPLNKRDVNHKDGNKANNALSNLEWATRSENQLHSYRTLGTIRKTIIGEGNLRNKPIIQLSMTGHVIREWCSASEAARELNMCESSIRKCLYTSIGKPTKERRVISAGGFKWRYVNI